MFTICLPIKLISFELFFLSSFSSLRTLIGDEPVTDFLRNEEEDGVWLLLMMEMM